ncbi:uncharacterized protein At4g18490 isoform X3 [Beta vulgaris subsp. vulgaris]|nr:uncharacterized protein At4g18490 isoform X3 [Beta vulgaris subsp. vulgaris]
MVDSEKDGSSTGETKTKMSLLDDDFSKDFLSSWKSMSSKGGDDMDFNFEPVSKGKKKAFDFGMDMDFSLDDAFGKMSSFKIDMPDLDFSSSPKKSTKSKEKSEEDFVKGDHQDKHEKFMFSFDFNGMDDFSLDAPSSKGGKSPSNMKKSNEDGSECEDLPREVTNDKIVTTEDSISKGPPVCENAAFPETEDFVAGDGNPDTPSGNFASKSRELTYPEQKEETEISSDKKLAENTHETDHQTYQEGDFSSKKSCSPGKENNTDPIPVNKPVQSVGSQMPVESAEVYMSPGIELTMTAMSTDDAFQLKEETTSKQTYTYSKEMDVSTDIPLVEASTEVNVSEEMQISSSDRSLNDGSSEGGIVGEIAAAVVLTSHTEKPALDKSSQQGSMDKMNICDEKIELEDGGSNANPLSSSAKSSSEMQKPPLKVFSAPFGSGPTAAKPMLLRDKVPGAMNSSLPVIQVTSGGGRTEVSAFEDNVKGSTDVGAVDKSSYGSRKYNGNKLSDNPSSCTKGLIAQNSVLEKSEKNSVDGTASRDHDGTVNGKYRNEVKVDNVPHSGKAAKDGLTSLECEKMIDNVKSSGCKIPSPAPPEQRTNTGNQGPGKDKIPNIASIQKFNIGQGHKFSSLRIDKKVTALPSLKITRSTTTNKHPASPTIKANFRSLGNFEKTTKLKTMIKTVSPVSSAEKKTPSTPSLKRKPSEATDTSLAKLRTPKRVSPSESRVPKVSARELEDGVQTQCTLLQGSRKNVTEECMTSKFNFDQEANMEALQFSLMMDNDENVEKAEACAKELDNICNMLKKKHEEAKELLVRALVNNNKLLMLNHPIYEDKIRAVQRFASKLISKELEVEA